MDNFVNSTLHPESAVTTMRVSPAISRADTLTNWIYITLIGYETLGFSKAGVLQDVEERTP